MGGIIFIVIFVFWVIGSIISANDNANNNKTYNRPKNTYPKPKYHNPKPKYQQPINNTPKPKKYYGNDILINIGVLGILISEVDGNSLFQEREKIYSWIKKRVSSSTAENKIHEIKNYVNYIKKGNFTSSVMKSEINHYLKIIKSECSINLKYEILKLYTEIIIADKVLHKNEKAAIYHIAKNIGVNIEKFMEIYQDQLPNNLLESAIDTKSLGILPTMTISEKKKILREQYRKWSDMITSNNSKIREKAEIMLEIISKERNKIKNNG